MNAWRTNPKGRLREGYNTQRITPYHMYPGGQVVQVWSWCFAKKMQSSLFVLSARATTVSVFTGSWSRDQLMQGLNSKGLLCGTRRANKLEQIVREIGKGRWIKDSKVYAHLKSSSHSQSARRQLPYTQDKNVTVEKDPVGLYARPPTTEHVEWGNCG